MKVAVFHKNLVELIRGLFGFRLLTDPKLSELCGNKN